MHLNELVRRSLDIVYHNPSVVRQGRWAGERGRQLIDALRAAGGEVRAIPAPPPARAPHGPRDSTRLIARIPRSLRGRVVTARLVQRGATNTVRWTWRLWRALRRERPDVIVARYHEYELTPLLVARLLRRPLVLEVHAPFGLEGTLRGRGPSRLASRVDRLFWRKAEILWAHTPELAELLVGQGADPDRVVLAPFGIPDPEVVADPGSDADPVEVVFAGSFYPWHGLDDLLAAFARARVEVPAMRLTMIGDGVTRADAEIQAKAFDLRTVTVFTGWLDRAALYRQLERSHIGVAPYRKMAHAYFEPVKILDYQMAGLPVIASDIGHIPSMVEHGENGLLVPPGDLDALASAIAKLASDPALRRTYGRAARRRAQHIRATAGAVLDMCDRAVST